VRFITQQLTSSITSILNATMASSSLCVACNDPLEMLIHDSDSDSESNSQAGPSSSSASKQETVPDDLHLPCNCHFHWQCLLDASPHVATTLSCPNCNAPLASSTPPQITATYTSEGGASEPLNLLPVVTEEAHLQSYPEERPARALHTMVAENDVEGIVELLRDAETAEERAALVGYRDPLAGGRNALHVAVEAGRFDAFWLLLWVGSGLDRDMFSEEMRRTMGSIKMERGAGGEDLRFMRDGEGRTAGEYAVEIGGEWERWVNAGVFVS
jgi:hypothetical protein